MAQVVREIQGDFQAMIRAFLIRSVAVLAPSLCLTGAIVGFSANGQTSNAPSKAEQGREIFLVECAPCHARGPGDDGRKMLPGTEALQIKYKGAIPPALEDRDNLSKEVLAVFIRQGVFSMPPFRKTEISDQDIDAIAQYLASDLSKQPAHH